jgi:hypothetical protein
MDQRSQIAQVLLNGTDLLVIGAVLIRRRVPYAMRPLVTLLANQAQMFMQLALPALSELRASAPRPRMFAVSSSMSQFLLISSGAIACVVLAVNGPFVSWWVGPGRFAGPGLTGLLVFGMLLRHWNLAAVYTLFCFGHERRLAITTAADGVVGLLAMLLFVLAGPEGGGVAIIGRSPSACPHRALAREEGAARRALRPLRRGSATSCRRSPRCCFRSHVGPTSGFWNDARWIVRCAPRHARAAPAEAAAGAMLRPAPRPWLTFPGVPRRAPASGCISVRPPAQKRG